LDSSFFFFLHLFSFQIYLHDVFRKRILRTIGVGVFKRRF
jgi:hypothetical protein